MEKARKEAEKERKNAEKEEKARKKAEKEAEKEQKKAEKEAEKERKKAEQERKNQKSRQSEEQGFEQQAVTWRIEEGLPTNEGVGLQLDAAGIATLDEMKAACEANLECVGFAYLPQKGLWFPKKVNTGFKPDAETFTQKWGSKQDWKWLYIVERAKEVATTEHNPPEDSRTYSSVWNGNAIGKGHARSMLDSQQAWSAKHNRAGEWMQIDLGKVIPVVGVVTQQRHDIDQRVTKFTLQYSEDASAWIEIRGEFIGHQEKAQTKDGKVEHRFAQVHARYVKFSVVEWNRHISMRAGVLEATKEVPDVLDLGAETGTKEEARMTMKLAEKNR